MAVIQIVFRRSGLHIRDAVRLGYIIVIIILQWMLFCAEPVYGEDLLADEIVVAAAISDIGPQLTESYFPAAASSRGVLNAIDILRKVGFVSAPESAYTRPGAVYVLPVILVPSDRGEMAPDPDNTGFNLAGEDFYTGCRTNNQGPCPAVDYARAQNNFAVHLQMARRKYETMLKNPLNGATRGTFRLASWSHARKRARAIHQYGQDITPLIVYSNFTADHIARLYNDAKSYVFVADVLKAANCKQTSCPYIFAISTPGINVAGGRKLNYGYNNGGGVTFFEFDDVRDSNVDKTPESNGSHFQSTLLHELGHAFGMPHIFDYCGFHPSDPLACSISHDEDLSYSIMGYNTDNWIFGCPQKKPPPLTDHCIFPDDITVIDTFPGILLADDLRVLGKNDLAIPGYVYDEALDSVSYRLSGQGDTNVALPRFSVNTIHTGGDSQLPGALIGGYSEAFPEFYEPVNAYLMWISRQANAFEWLPFDVTFPEPVTLTRVRFYSGCTMPAGTTPVCSTASGVRAGMADGSTSSVITNPPGANVDLLLPPVPGTAYTLGVRTGSSGTVTLRGIRFFGIVDGEERELFPPDEPVATTAFGNAFGGSLASITGSDQIVSLVSETFNPATSWHSDPVKPGRFVSLEVIFPHTVSLGYVKAHTGHSTTFHVAEQVQIERSCLCDASQTGIGSACSSVSSAQCAAVGDGNSIYEFVKRVNSGPDELVDFTATSSRVWKIALRTQNPGKKAWMVVRGLRFFNDQGLEMFPAKQVPN